MFSLLLLLACIWRGVAAQGEVVVSPTATPNVSISRMTLTRTRAISTIASETPCCVLLPTMIAVHEWWNTSYTATVQTVLTQYLQYNNTVIPNVTTIYDEGAISRVPVPSFIFPQVIIYGRTVYDTRTEIDMDSTAVPSPTPLAKFQEVMYLQGTQSGSECNYGPSVMTLAWSKPYYHLAPTGTFWTSQIHLTSVPDGYRDIIREEKPEEYEEYNVASCTHQGRGEGEPFLHIPVSALTAHKSTTIRMSGIWSDGAGRAPAEPTPGPQIPEPVVRPTSEEQFPPRPTDPAPQRPNPEEPTPRPGIPPNPLPSPGNGSPNGGSPNDGSPNGGGSPNGQNPVPENRRTTVAPIVVGGTPLPVAVIPPAQGGGVVVTPEDGSAVTIQPGSSVTLGSGHIISMPEAPPQNGNAGPTGVPGEVGNPNPTPEPIVVVVDGTTTPLTPSILPPEPSSPAALITSVLTIGDSTITISYSPGAGVILPNGETLLPGSTAVVEGETISLEPSGTAVVLESTTIALPTGTEDLGQGAPSNTGPAEPGYTGGAERQGGRNEQWVLGVAVVISLVFMVSAS